MVAQARSPALRKIAFHETTLRGAHAMDQLVLFCLFGASALIGWFGRRKAAIGIFFVALALTAADYLHHATDALKLSF